VDHYFWHLPFASVKQAHSVRERAGTPQDEWDKRMAQMQAEHETEGAREQLASGWKAWLAERCGEAAGAEAVGVGVQGGDTIEVLD